MNELSQADLSDVLRQVRDDSSSTPEQVAAAIAVVGPKPEPPKDKRSMYRAVLDVEAAVEQIYAHLTTPGSAPVPSPSDAAPSSNGTPEKKKRKNVLPKRLESWEAVALDKALAKLVATREPFAIKELFRVAKEFDTGFPSSSGAANMSVRCYLCEKAYGLTARLQSQR